ncbi:hypothetical protein [Prevotella sp. AGR2160]|uniref:hypothetical protein n=1 Tax=Prevotella sp. AGR2160 TaxID=1280674 RepID=UPI00048C9F61|nr:hypothetical protein [Prevotella sp. AGR2160]
MKKYIHLKKEDREFVMKSFGISARSVYNALHFDTERSNSELSKRIRRLAMQRGGIVMVEVPESETLFDADGYMRQYLANGVLLEFNLKDGSCDVLLKGEKARRYEHVAVSEIPTIQSWAQTLR